MYKRQIKDSTALISLEEIDSVIDFARNEDSKALLQGINAKQIGPKKRFFDGILNLFRKKRTDAYSLAFEQASGLGIQDDRKGIQFTLDNNAVLSSTDLPTALMAGYICVVIPKFSNQSDVNFLKGIKDFCNRINHPVLLLGEQEVSGLAGDIALQDDTKIYNATGKFSKQEMAHIVDMAKVVIGPAGLWISIAAALKKKVVVLLDEVNKGEEISNLYDEFFVRQKPEKPYIINTELLALGNSDKLLAGVNKLLA